jgi:hypothetical protein
MTYQTDDVVILTDGYWRQHFNADPHVIGRTVWVDNIPRTVIGVLPPGFRFLSSRSQLYLPLWSSPEQRLPLERHSGGNVIQMIARLKAGAADIRILRGRQAYVCRSNSERIHTGIARQAIPAFSPIADCRVPICKSARIEKRALGARTHRHEVERVSLVETEASRAV